MTNKMTPEQLKAVFDLSDTSDVTQADRTAVREIMGRWIDPTAVRLLKHYHPELFVDPRLEAAKKLAREIVAEEYEKHERPEAARVIRRGEYENLPEVKAVTRALLMDPPTGEADDA